MADKQPAEHPALEALTMARMINRLHGGNVIAAWQVNQLDLIWLDVFLGLSEDLPALRQRQQLIAAEMKKFEAEHPTYMSYRKRH